MQMVIYWMEQLSTSKEIAGSFGVAPDTLTNAVKKFFGKPYKEVMTNIHPRA